MSCIVDSISRRENIARQPKLPPNPDVPAWDRISGRLQINFAWARSLSAVRPGTVGGERERDDVAPSKWLRHAARTGRQ
jgi:hypothetical protein